MECFTTQFAIAAQVFFAFAVITNLLVSLSMLQGCVSVINTLTNVNVYAISFLIPIGVVLYATIGGKRPISAVCKQLSCSTEPSRCFMPRKCCWHLWEGWLDISSTLLVHLTRHISVLLEGKPKGQGCAGKLQVWCGLPPVTLHARPPHALQRAPALPRAGLKATFTTAYMHTVIIYIVCLVFAFKVYVPGDLLAGIDQARMRFP